MHRSMFRRFKRSRRRKSFVVDASWNQNNNPPEIMLRSRSWFSGLLGRPKNAHSLEHLKYLYNVLSKNQTVSESNRSLLVETLRSIAEILIWGDQNDSTVFDFFLEKNMLSFFLKIMRQKCGSYVCVQLLQTLNILFENIRNETSLYYLLSNNHVNSIIVHKFDFSDEEVMAYYISFLKTLSLKLNTHTIHFFYNEHTNDFPLYTEAIKFFNHSESMVRIAVRTLTLNVYGVRDTSMLEFIRNKTAAPYFSNLVWFIGKHVAELDSCLRADVDHRSSGKLADLVAEHLDHLHYLNDILQLEISDLNEVLTDHLLNKLFLPLYIGSLSHIRSQGSKCHVKKAVALFLLSQVFLIISHAPIVQLLAGFLLDHDTGLPSRLECTLTPPIHLGEEHCDSEEVNTTSQDGLSASALPTLEVLPTVDENKPVISTPDETTSVEEPNPLDLDSSGTSAGDGFPEISSDDTSGTLNASISDEEKSKLIGLSREAEDVSDLEVSLSPRQRRLSLRPCLFAILHTLDIIGDDYSALFALCLLYAIAHNQGVGKDRLKGILNPAESGNDYNVAFIEKLVKLACHACSPDPYIRLVTLDMSIKVLREMALIGSEECALTDAHVASLAGGREEITSVLRSYYKTEDMFLDLFEDEFNEFSKKPLRVDYLMMDAAVLLPPTATPMTGIEFTKRLPCGEVERVRRAIRVYFFIRQLCIDLGVEKETVSLPLTSPQPWGVQVDNVLDLNNSDLISCTVVYKDGTKIRRFMVIDVIQFILVDPDTRKLGWGVAKLVGFLQDLEISTDKDDNRCLHITLHRPLSSSTPLREPLLVAKFLFDDQIRCMAANQRLTKGRNKARQKKMHQIAKLLDLPSTHQASPSPLYVLRGRPGSGGRSRDLPSIAHRQVYAAARRDSAPANAGRSSSRSRDSSATRPRDPSGSRARDSSVSRTREPSASRTRESSASRTRRREEGSPLRVPRPRSEEIPLEDIRSRQRRENILLSGLVATRQPVPLVTPTPSASPVPLAKEREGETSFTENEERLGESSEPKPRKKGQVETV